MNLKNPKVTVLMPVYNGGKHLNEAIESILAQTFADFEFLIINDGSTDNSAKIIESFNDKRIRLIKNNKNLKLVKTLNKGIDFARGKYIVRMDQDDISFPERLSKQVGFMEKHPDIGVCGSRVELIGKNSGQVWDFVPENPDILKCLLLFSNYIVHPTVIIRKKLLEKYHLHYNEIFAAEDYDLWCRISEYSRMSNLQEVLLYYREHSSKMSQINRKDQIENANLIQKRQILKFGVDINHKELKIHNAIGLWEYAPNKSFIIDSNKWLTKLSELNKKKLIYPEPEFFKVLSDRWYDICSSSTKLGLFTWKIFWYSSLSKRCNIDFIEKFRFFVKCILKWKR